MSKPGKGKLYFDIETSLMIVYTFAIGYKINISHDNILKDMEIICICYKWENENKVHSLKWDPKSKSRDKKMLREFVKVLEQADELVAQNGLKFDLTSIRTRLAYYDLPPLPPVNFYDTLTYNRKYFRFASNKLDHVAKYLGSKGKDKMEMQDWRDVEVNKPGILKKFVDYCKRDVLELELVEKKTRKHVPENINKRNIKHYDGCSESGCKGKLHPRGYKTSSVCKRQRYRCSGCGKWSLDTSYVSLYE